MLVPASHGFGNDIYESNTPNNNSLHLGQWRNQISEKLNPSYFSQLNHLSTDNRFAINQFNYSVEEYNFEAPVFSQSDFSSSLNHSQMYFSFSSQSKNATPFALNQFISSLSPNAQFSKSNSNHQIVQQDFYAPSYNFSHGKSSFGLGFVLVQQRFLDDSFGSVTYAISSPSSISDDPSFLNTNRGTGYNLNFAQKLPGNINLYINYQSKIEMNEFDLFGQSYSDPGDFNIPSHYSISLSVPIFKTHKVDFMAEKILYSSIDTNVHSGYSTEFLSAFNSPISPIYEQDDITVYSMNYEKLLSEQTSFNLGVLSRQQAPALANIYNRILKNDTAQYSYQLGLIHQLSFGKINFVASYANKPIMIGSTDFGRFSSSTLNKHLEGVLSWNLRF